MMRQIRRPDLLAPLVKLDELVRLHVIHWRRDVASGIINLGWAAAITPRHRIRPSQMQGPQGSRIRSMDTRRRSPDRHGSDRQGQFLRRDRAMSSDVAGRDAQFALAEDVGGEDVDDAEDDDDDAGGDDDAPVGCAQGFLGRGFFVEVAEDGDADDDHEDAQGNKAVGGGEEGPGAGEVEAEEGGFS
ncbi:MAG: hypothetical protein Q9179_004454 [Wetmoreana sp. 5 TL-2023]